MRSQRALAVIAALIGLVISGVALAGPIQAAPTRDAAETQTRVTAAVDRPPGYYLLQNAINGRCADVSGESQAPGALVHQWGCVEGANQLWSPVDLGNGYFQLKNLNSPNMCMNVKDSAAVSGTLIEQWPCDGRQSEWWQWAAADSFGHLVLNSGLGNWCLALSPYSARNRTSIVIRQCATTSAQMWKFA